MTRPQGSTPPFRCACPFCGYARRHAPPTCKCFVCSDGRKGAAHPVSLKVAEIPAPHKDVAELLAVDGGEARYEAMIREARPGLMWMIDHLEDVRGHDLTTTEGLVNACEDLVDALLSQPPIARGQYVRELAQKMEIPEQDIRDTLGLVMKERGAYYRQHPEERPDVGMDIPTL